MGKRTKPHTKSQTNDAAKAARKAGRDRPAGRSPFELSPEQAMQRWGEIPEPVVGRTRGSEDVRVVRELQDRLRSLGRTQRDILRTVALIDLRSTWRDDGARDMPEWLAAEHGISKTEARLWVRASHALEDLPVLSDALERGRLSLQKTVHLARFATPETEAELIRWAKKVTLATVRERADAETRRDRADLQEQQRQRYLSWRIEQDGWYSLAAGLPASQGAAVVKAVEQVTKEIPVSPEDVSWVEDPRERARLTESRRRADALVGLVTSGPADDARQPTVVVHADLSAFFGGSGSCYVEGGPALHPDVAKLLACDSRLELVGYRDGKITGIDPARRTPSPALRRAVGRRDHHTCTFPGCEMRAYLRTHHIAWYRFLGRTQPDDLVLVCPTHHDLIHIYGWRVELDRDHRTVWFRPNGTRYEPGQDGGPEDEDERDMPEPVALTSEPSPRPRAKPPDGLAIF